MNLNKTKSTLLIVAAWVLALSLVYLVYLKFRLLFH
jgi:hypothetical protein